jgi:hypothetical protein
MPDLIEQVAGKHDIPVRAQGALRLIRLRDCGKIVDVCRSSKLLILGIEAFTLSQDRVIPVTDLIADFSELASKEWDAACLEAARSADTFLDVAKNRTDLWFDFSLKGRE